MPEEKGIVQDINVRQLLPWTEIFRSFQIALDPTKLLLAAAAIVLNWLGWWILSLPFGTEEPNPTNFKNDPAGYQRALRDHTTRTHFREWPPNQKDRGANPYQVATEAPKALLDYDFWRGQTPVLLEPLQKFIWPVTRLIKANPAQWEWWWALFGTIMTLAIWAIFGGAITRIAAVQLARKEKIGMTEALRFASGKFMSFFSAPLIPFIIVTIILVLLSLGAVLFHIPWLGDFLGAVFYFLAFAGAIAMALILVGLVGWPLMYATISAEGSDSFDALSRCYAYLFQRVWHYLFYAVVSLIYGVIVIFFVVFMTSLVVYLTKWGLGIIPWFSWRGDPISQLYAYAPESYHWRELLTGPGYQPEESASLKMAGGIMAFWLHLVFLFMLGFAYSYFWSSSTIVYFLMRKKVDDIDMDEVYIEEEDEMYASSTPPPAAPGAGPVATLPMAPAGSEPEPPKSAEPPKATEPPSKPPTPNGDSTKVV